MFDHKKDYWITPSGWNKWGDRPAVKPIVFPDTDIDEMFPIERRPEEGIITVIVVASDGQIHTYKGPESGLRKWINKLRRKGVKVGVENLKR